MHLNKYQLMRRSFIMSQMFSFQNLKMENLLLQISLDRLMLFPAMISPTSEDIAQELFMTIMQAYRNGSPYPSALLKTPHWSF